MFRRYSHIADLENKGTKGRDIFTCARSCCCVHPFPFLLIRTFSYMQRHQYEHASRYPIFAHLFSIMASTTHGFRLIYYTLDQPFSLPHAKPNSFKLLKTNVSPTPHPTSSPY